MLLSDSVTALMWKRAGIRPLLVGGGVGVPPLFNLAKKLIAAGRSVIGDSRFQQSG